jgi:caffeoyl-CoA O-methyltransferase
MGAIVTPEIETYISSLGVVSDPVLEEMEKHAKARQFPIIGQQVGRLLEILARFSSARRILELGSGFGYSAWWFARGLQPGGVIHCTDASAENRDLAMGYFRKAGRAERIVFHVGDALKEAESLKGPFDIVFNDIDKDAYPRSIETALRLLRTGGLFITDNTLWDGRVAEGGSKADPMTAGVKKFNELIFGRTDLVSVILPVRDGVAVCAKK